MHPTHIIELEHFLPDPLFLSSVLFKQCITIVL